METRNPEREAIDTRLLSEKIEDDGNAPQIEPTKQGVDIQGKEEITEDGMSELTQSSSSVSELLQELDRFEIRTMEDIQRIRRAVDTVEGGR